ncbi:MAG: hypothetical protein WC749_03090 [Dehalococcoidia bacterium]
MMRITTQKSILTLSIVAVTVIAAGIIVANRPSDRTDRFDKTVQQLNNNRPLDIRTPVVYTEPLVIAVLNNVLEIRPMNASASAKAMVDEQNANIIRYTDAYPSTDVEQIKYPNKLKESLILKSSNHPDRFEYTINASDYLWEIDAEGNIIFSEKTTRDFSDIKSDDGKKVSSAVARQVLPEHQKIFKIPKPFMVEQKDLGKEWQMDVEKGEVKVLIKGDKLILTPDLNWIKNHRYPIVVDPTIEQIPEATLQVNEQGFVPIEPQRWQNASKIDKFQKRIGGPMASYERDSGTWAAIENNWARENEHTFSNLTDLLKTRVSDTGESQVTLNWNGVHYAVSQKLEKLVWLDTAKDQLAEIGSPQWQAPNMDADTVGWDNVFPDVDYKIKKNNSQVQHQIHFKPGFLNHAVSQFDSLPNKENIALGNMMMYELKNVDNADAPIGDVYDRIFKDLGAGYTFMLYKQYLHFPGEEEARAVPVVQKWFRKDNKIYCIEYVMMDEIKKIHQEQPSATLWHNTETQISGTTNVEDASISNAAADNNTGGSIILSVRNATVLLKILIRVKNVASSLGANATISAATVSLYCDANTTDGDVSAYRVFKPWIEGVADNTDPGNASGDGATWNDWDADASEWGTVGAGNASDSGADNSGDGTDYDIKTTAESTTNVTTVNTWYSWSVAAALAQGWYDGTIGERGVLLYGPNNRFTSTEGASNTPYWTFTYTAPAATGSSTMKLNSGTIKIKGGTMKLR